MPMVASFLSVLLADADHGERHMLYHKVQDKADKCATIEELKELLIEYESTTGKDRSRVREIDKEMELLNEERQKLDSQNSFFYWRHGTVY